ncbi:hypothetical protein DM860_014545 [Cuscuta australis]|uniref:Uncharacterized protein n=1 Tax=Cuscuta australis TaxID=267555 RepID=A0A328E2D1_9ASTE|nr:hypothetical protein DM860_014545 [Cuscuta australis]
MEYLGKNVQLPAAKINAGRIREIGGDREGRAAEEREFIPVVIAADYSSAHAENEDQQKRRGEWKP